MTAAVAGVGLVDQLKVILRSVPLLAKGQLYMYVCMHVCLCVYIFVYIYIHVKDRDAWRAAVHAVAKNQTCLSN